MTTTSGLPRANLEMRCEMRKRAAEADIEKNESMPVDGVP